MNARVAIPLLVVVALIALVIGALTGVVAVIIFGALGLVAAIVGGIWSGIKLRSRGSSDYRPVSSRR